MFSVLRSKKLRTNKKKKAAFGGLLFFLYVFFPIYSNAASNEACVSEVLSVVEQKKIYQDPQWLRLLHFRRTFPFFQSQADGPYFFLDKSGSKNPEAEMKTFVKALCEGSLHKTGKEVISELPVRCQFPAREKFLLDSLNLSTAALSTAPWPQMDCPQLDQWRKRMDPASLTLVFSSYYPNSPSSVFGHTLIRVNRKKIAGVFIDSPLLSQGVNFAAVSDTKNPFKYALWGMFGGFPGEFAAMPYFYKVREYSDSESRDLWEYDLNLNQAELDLFVDHVWELSFTYFDYFYFNENCSYHLLTTLEAVIPNINPSDKLPWWVIPADTIKEVVKTKGLVQKINFRPSVYRQFIARYEKIQNTEKLKSAFNKVVFEKDLKEVKTLSDYDQALVMDASLDFWDFKYFRSLIDEKSKESNYKQQLLIYRAKLPSTDELVFPVDEKLQPEKSHGSMRYGLGFGNENVDGNFAELDLRFALHDLLDDSQGLPDHAKIDFFRLRGRTFESFNKSRIESFRFVDIELLAPINDFHYPASWRFLFGSQRTRHLFCDGCMAPDLLMQGGYSVDTFRKKLLFYALGGLHMYWPEGVGSQWAPQFNTGLRIQWSAKLGSLIEGEWQQVIGPQRDAYRSVHFETRYLPKKDLALGIDLKKGDNNDFESIFKFYIYR